MLHNIYNRNVNSTNGTVSNSFVQQIKSKDEDYLFRKSMWITANYWFFYGIKQLFSKTDSNNLNQKFLYQNMIDEM